MSYSRVDAWEDQRGVQRGEAHRRELKQRDVDEAAPEAGQGQAIAPTMLTGASAGEARP